MRLTLFAPESFMLLAALFFLSLSMIGRFQPRRDHLAALVLAAVGVVVSLAAVPAEGSLFAQTYRIDLFSQVFKVLLSLGLFLIACISGNLRDIPERSRHDFYLLLFTCTSAMMMLVSGDHLLTIYIALEVSSYSLYTLVALRRTGNMGLEAGLKYFLIGIFASAVMVFGLAILFGMTNALYLRDLVQVMPGLMDRPAVIIGLLLALSGFFFKLALFPFHFWVPDVYQGASNQVTAYIATASKVAAIAIVIRIVALAGEGSAAFAHILVILSIVSMTVGNLAAIVQKDFKRLLGYSTIAHAGYVLIGILALSATGFASAIFYALALLVMKFTAFLVIVAIAGGGENLQIEGLAGLHRRSPLLALGLMVALFSLAGIPPTIGFTGKFLLFVAAVQKGYLILVLIAMINVVISLYYYLLVIKAAYLLEPKEPQPRIKLSRPMTILTGSLIAVMVVAGFFPYYLMQIAEATARALM